MVLSVSVVRSECEMKMFTKLPDTTLFAIMLLSELSRYMPAFGDDVAPVAVNPEIFT